ncbi:hypothetical protein NDU88_006644 [Pleurodeles waltl]|uniref:Uncharacterized protein n=1 Tax=Pleurodeles waltl TaxID=8319 RepID=A0AAV7QLC3_PLEWA|nr:hypothetical protein NDU88_006644 [Pleurodeles waltl]
MFLTLRKMCGENRSPIPGFRPRCSGKDDVRTEKGGTAGTAAREMDRGPCCDPTRQRRRDVRRNIGILEEHY